MSDTAYTVPAWAGFGGIVAGVTATLAGLLFVAISINIRPILDSPNLPNRAGQTLTVFGMPLVTGILLIVPGQPRVALGAEFLVIGAGVGTHMFLTDRRAERYENQTLLILIMGRVLPGATSCGALIACGASLLADGGGGMYWDVASVVAAVVFGLINAWVLMVEILR